MPYMAKISTNGYHNPSSLTGSRRVLHPVRASGVKVERRLLFAGSWSAHLTIFRAQSGTLPRCAARTRRQSPGTNGKIGEPCRYLIQGPADILHHAYKEQRRPSGPVSSPGSELGVPRANPNSPLLPPSPLRPHSRGGNLLAGYLPISTRPARGQGNA